jgi:hypothetical protein
MLVFGFILLACNILRACYVDAQYQGILINGRKGTQVYDPVGTPHAQGPILLNLPIIFNAYGSAATISGQVAYVAGGIDGNFVIKINIYVLKKTCRRFTDRL